LQENDGPLDEELPEHSTLFLEFPQKRRPLNQPTEFFSDSGEEEFLLPIDASADFEDPEAASCVLPLTRENL
jgi:hypothetical protein